MASGNLYLELTEQIGWEVFPSYATELLNRIGGIVTDKAEAVDVRIWYVQIESCNVRLVYDDFPVRVSIESQDQAGNELIEQLHGQLKDTFPHR